MGIEASSMGREVRTMAIETALVSHAFVTTEEKIFNAERLVADELRASGQDVCVTNSFQAEDMVVLDMVAADNCRRCRWCFSIRGITSRRCMRIAIAWLKRGE